MTGTYRKRREGEERGEERRWERKERKEDREENVKGNPGKLAHHVRLLSTDYTGSHSGCSAHLYSAICKCPVPVTSHCVCPS